MTTYSVDPWLRMGAAAEQLGVSVDTLRSWCDSGKVPCWRTPGGERRIRQSAVNRALADEPTEAAS